MDIEQIAEQMPKVDCPFAGAGAGTWMKARDNQCYILAKEGYRLVPSVEEIGDILLECQEFDGVWYYVNAEKLHKQLLERK